MTGARSTTGPGGWRTASIKIDDDEARVGAAVLAREPDAARWLGDITQPLESLLCLSGQSRSTAPKCLNHRRADGLGR